MSAKLELLESAKMRSIQSATLALVVIATPLGAASAPVELAQTGPWQVNYDDNACHLLGQFGTDTAAIVTRMTRYQPGDSFDLTLYGHPLKTLGLNAALTIDFGLADKPFERSGLAGTVRELPMILAGGMRLDGRYGDGEEELPPLTPAQEAQARALTIGLRGKQYRLMTGPLDKPLAALRTCQTDLVKHWGYDPEVQASLTRKPKPKGNPGTWARPGDFPSGPLSNGRSGRVKIRLDVDPAGGVTGCNVLAQTIPTDFGVTTCRILARRGRFDPALDKDGKPVRSFWVSSVTWIS
jgi:hypothetical protein